MFSQSAKLLAALLLSGAAGTAAAAVPSGLLAEAEIDFSSFAFQIYDLDLNDGIDPALEWVSGASVGSIATNNFSHFPFSQHEDGLAPVSTISGSAAGADVLNSDQTARASGAMTQATPSLFMVNASSNKQGYFTLSGPAAVVFSVNYAVSAYDDNIHDNFYSFAQASLSGTVNFADGANGYFGSRHEVNYDGHSGVLKTSFVNTNGTADGYIYLDSQIAMGQNTAPVPEPSEYLMMLAGLGVVGYAARRRRQG